MRWFRKQSEAPRLISLSPIRTDSTRLEHTSTSENNPKSQVRRRSRIGEEQSIRIR